jgi:hypothetical protein
MSAACAVGSVIDSAKFGCTGFFSVGQDGLAILGLMTREYSPGSESSGKRSKVPDKALSGQARGEPPGTCAQPLIPTVYR